MRSPHFLVHRSQKRAGARPVVGGLLRRVSLCQASSPTVVGTTEAARTVFLEPASLRVVCSLNQVHEIPGRLTICLGLECDIQVRGRSQNMQQCPKGEPFTAVFRQTQVDQHVLDAGAKRFRWDRCQV